MSWMLCSVFMMVVFLLPLNASAQAIRFQPQGAAAAGQGNAFAAQADDASAIHFNPAGLTQVEGVQSIAGSNLMGGSIKYKSPAGLILEVISAAVSPLHRQAISI